MKRLALFSNMVGLVLVIAWTAADAVTKANPICPTETVEIVTPIAGAHIQVPEGFRVEFLGPAGTRLSIFVQNVNPQTGLPGGQAFVIGADGIKRSVDAKFGPDGALYLVDIGAIRDAGMTGAGVLDPAHAPFVQIPGTGVIWKISPL